MEAENLYTDFDKIAQHWTTTANEDFEAMQRMFDAKLYHWCLFLGHIALEKLLKALFVQERQMHAPRTHNLFRLAELAGIPLSDEHADWLDMITTFNLNARYDDHKRTFFKLCTLGYTQ